MPHPCFGRDLRAATRLIAFVDIVWTSIFIALAIVILISNATSFIVVHQQELVSSPAKTSTSTTVVKVENEDVTKIELGGLIVGTIILVVKILQLLLAVYLFQGAMERNPYKCKIWIYITCVFVIITVMNFLFDVISVEGSKTGSYISVIGIVLHAYFLWIVWAYKQELEQSRTQPQAADAGAVNLKTLA